MKRLKYFDTSPNYVSHPSYVLREAAKALAYDAHLLRKERLTIEAKLVMHYSKSLLAVSNGATWASALHFPEEAKK